MRDTIVNCLIERARIDKSIYLITSDMGYGVLDPFKDEFPDRYLNVGIAEQNSIGVASGLALSGKNVYVYSIIPFVIMRCFEQVRIDIAYMNTNVKLIGVGAGLSYGAAGATHHAIEDIALMRSLPNMTVCCPGDPLEAKALIEESFRYKGPMYFRLGNNGEPLVHHKSVEIQIGKATEIKSGHDLALITTSNMLAQAKEWVDKLEKMGKSVTLTSFHTIKPLDKEYIRELINRKIPIYTLEEHNIYGGLGTAVAEIIAEHGEKVSFKRIALPDEYSHYVGNQNYLRGKFNILEIPDYII
ncbi:transketolase family protein [Paenibacillus chitinolyticus]|uniref:transketolase family protein n=1 Tax=Paenibacillus chitinolyticus TaxID=79263 RepID=UPI0036DD3768